MQLWVVVAACVLAAWVVLRLILALFRRIMFPNRKHDADVCIGFFHPYCNAAGGGERVLWCALESLGAAAADRRIKVIIYSGDKDVDAETALSRARERFGLELGRNGEWRGGGPHSGMSVEFAYIGSRTLLEAWRYPRFTLIGQSVGSMVVAADCLRRAVPDIWVDTTGAAFTFFVARLAGVSRVACYVHYPTISTDMLQRVQAGRPDYNHDSAIAASRSLTAGKLLYYRAFAAAYSWCGLAADAIMVNSSWTAAHVAHMWRTNWKPQYSNSSGSSNSSGGGQRQRRCWGLLPAAVPAQVVYPPCNTDNLRALPLPATVTATGAGAATAAGKRQRLIISIAQFRPEKDHALQLRAFAEFRRRDPAAFADVRLCLMGGCRDDGDAARVAALKQLAAQLQCADAVDFVLNAPFGELKAALGRSLCGLHTMWCEHFGIGVVEMQAAGVITIAHNSGGPKTDIVVPWTAGASSSSNSSSNSSSSKGRGVLTATDGPRVVVPRGSPQGAGPGPGQGQGQGQGGALFTGTGFLAATPEEYADALECVFRGGVDVGSVAASARDASGRFSDAAFCTAFASSLQPLIDAVARSGGSGGKEQ